MKNFWLTNIKKRDKTKQLIDEEQIANLKNATKLFPLQSPQIQNSANETYVQKKE